MELIEDEIGLLPTSVTTFYSPLTEVREDIGNESRSPTPTINIEGWGEDWIKLVQSYVDPEGRQNCLYCDMTLRNLESRIKINH